MKRRNNPDPQRTIKRATLVISLIVLLAFSLLFGVTGIAMGLGSLYPPINMIAKPFVCGGGEFSYEQSRTQVGSASYWSVRWYCANNESASRVEIEATKVHLFSGVLYGLAFFAAMTGAVYLYWNSSIGPAKNDGLRLW
ncbi:MAG TPA: hypothetical protein VJV05_12920 [Pyrinomonadaceae bacterium]|nr:hypothetical protein [Pyrinomonadaceae bacterium]